MNPSSTVEQVKTLWGNLQDAFAADKLNVTLVAQMTELLEKTGFATLMTGRILHYNTVPVEQSLDVRRPADLLITLLHEDKRVTIEKVSAEDLTFFSPQQNLVGSDLILIRAPRLSRAILYIHPKEV